MVTIPARRRNPLGPVSLHFRAPDALRTRQVPVARGKASRSATTTRPVRRACRPAPGQRHEAVVKDRTPLLGAYPGSWCGWIGRGRVPVSPSQALRAYHVHSWPGTGLPLRLAVVGGVALGRCNDSGRPGAPTVNLAGDRRGSRGLGVRDCRRLNSRRLI
jgi:hypothetical protein